MPTFEVWVDGIAVARPSDAAMFAFSAQVLITRDNGTFLGVHGSVRSETARSLVEWVSRPIPIGCTIEVAYVSNERDDAPDPKSSELQADIERNKADVKTILKSLKKSMGLANRPLQPEPRVLPALSIGLEVTVPPAEPVSALLAAEETLQAVLTWSRGQCKVAVDSITVLPGGHTKGTTYLACTLEPGQRVTVRSVA